METRTRKRFTDEFKNQIVQLYLHKKPKYQNSGSFREKDNRRPEERELQELRKQNKQLLMENDINQASCADHRTKKSLICENKNKYGVSALCRVLQFSRSTFYYKAKEPVSQRPLIQAIITIFKASRGIYGARKIKVELKKQGRIVSLRRIRRIMKKNGLVSKYTTAHFRPKRTGCNPSPQIHATLGYLTPCGYKAEERKEKRKRRVLFLWPSAILNYFAWFAADILLTYYGDICEAYVRLLFL